LLIFFSLLLFVFNLEVLSTFAESTKAATSSSSVKKLTVPQSSLLGVVLSFAYEHTEDTTNTLRARVSLITNEKEVFAPIYRADNSKYKVVVAATFYIGEKIVYEHKYSSKKNGELLIYLDDIKQLNKQKEGLVRIELNPLSVGGVSLEAMKYHDKVYREYKLPIPKRKKKVSNNEQKKKKTGGTFVAQFLNNLALDMLAIGGAALVIGYFLGMLQGKRKLKKYISQQEEESKFSAAVKKHETFKTNASSEQTGAHVPESDAKELTPGTTVVPAQKTQVIAASQPKLTEGVTAATQKDAAVGAHESNEKAALEPENATMESLERLKALQETAQRLLDRLNK